jgi:hypothetical protein
MQQADRAINVKSGECTKVDEPSADVLASELSENNRIVAAYLLIASHRTARGGYGNIGLVRDRGVVASWWVVLSGGIYRME